MESEINNRKILVTGANGFIGGHLIKTLFGYGASIYTINRKPALNTSYIEKQYIGDLRDRSFISKCIKQTNPQHIFHLAAFKQRNSNLELFLPAIETNLIGSLNLFVAASKLKTLKSFVVLGTAEEYGNVDCPFVENMREYPINAYSFSKTCQTHLCETFHILSGMPFTVVRPTLAYGPGQGADMFLPSLINALINNKSFPMTYGQQTRDFIYISDLVDALVHLTECKKVEGQILNIGSGEPIVIANIALKVEKMLKKTNLIKFGEIDYRPGEIMEYFVDIMKVQSLLGWAPKVTLEEGLQNTIDYYLRGD